METPGYRVRHRTSGGRRPMGRHLRGPLMPPTRSLAELYRPPIDGFAGCFIGRAWLPDVQGPAVVVVDDGGVFDITPQIGTTSALFDLDAPAQFARTAKRATRLGSLAELLANSDEQHRDAAKPWFLTPIDLQAVKAAGVTFAASLLERVVEEQARGNPAAAQSIRATLAKEIGADLSTIKPGSADAEALRKV